MLMKKEFAPFLKDVLPSLFQMAALNPAMGIQGSANAGDLVDVLSEVKPDGTLEKVKFNISTDEIEEKDVAIQMLAVFIDELGSGFAKWVEPTSKILLAMVSYEANDSIRNSVAGALPGLINCVKEAQPGNQAMLINMGRVYLDALWKAVQTETETDTMICQIQAVKEIVDEVGSGFLNQDAVNAISKQLIDMYHKSDERIKENNEMGQKGGDGEEDEDD